jgi:hypothetical protein
MRAVELGIAVAAAALAATGAVCPVAAQNAEPPRPPRILDTPAPVPAPRAASEPRGEPPAALPPLGVHRPPNAARLAPLPLERRDEPEEIVVIGQGWRLPDLGSEWRARQKEAEGSGRFSATVLPLYDPNEPPLHSDAFTSREQRRHGYIELFRLRFGRRSTD